MHRDELKYRVLMMVVTETEISYKVSVILFFLIKNLFTRYTARFLAFKPPIILNIIIDYSLFNIFADLVSLRSILVSFHNLGNIADEKLSKFLFRTRSNLYDFVLFGSAKDLTFPLPSKICLSLKYPCINVRTQSLYESSRLRTFSFENNGLECTIINRYDCLFFFAKNWFFAVKSF